MIEKQEDWSHIGYTIGIWDMGRQVLAKLGLAEEFDNKSKRISNYYMETPTGHVLRLYHFDEFYAKYESAYSHISRKTLHSMLLKKSDANVQVGTTVSRLQEKGKQVLVDFSHGKKNHYDLVVGADGVNSQIREQVFGTHCAFTGNKAWFGWLPSKYKKRNSVVEYIGNNRSCNIFDEPYRACVVLIVPEDPGSHEINPKSRKKKLQNHFRDFSSKVLEIIASAEELLPTAIRFVDTENWVKDRFVIIGDAAHAMEPFAGIGASMGMEDAYVLSEELLQMASPDDLGKTLERYMKRRLPRIRIAKRQTREMNWWFTKKIPGLALTRNFFSPIVPIRHFTKGYKILLETKP